MNLDNILQNGIAITAMITPFKEDMSIDEEKYREFIRFQLENNCHPLSMGTTGESATLSHEEHHEAIDITIDEAKKINSDSFVLAGTGSNSTKEAISLSIYAEEAGADALLIVVPYYNKPVQHSLIDHYSAIADAVSIPIILYNVPSRTGRNLEPETISTLAYKKDNIAGIKCASGDINQITQIIKKTPDDFVVLSGDDPMTYHLMALGGKGVISVASNIIPARISEFVGTMIENDWLKARKIQLYLYDLFKVLFIETNPGPVKFAAGLMNIMNDRMRLPLTSPLDENQEKIKKVLRALNLI
ncbi:MAG: 4-hydroxy-tetrahydrodipicolinate synthase [Candidatus Lokiarchaeota archaeon]|nr:4-hydroxy-tetrahydrodipicolinate synthase [Candidatus Lokiarchaeota archaeon]MBD3202290.1 4-hydroxy-tetrahydrodipicolinate synthase [Candidatus Lokiarchaeota archaeon]